MPLFKVAIAAGTLLAVSPSPAQHPKRSNVLDASKNPVITLTCVNPKTNVAIASYETHIDGLGRAVSDLVQFNVDTPAKDGALFIDHHNNGECTASIDANHSFLSGYAVIEKSFVYGSDIFNTRISRVVNPDYTASSPFRAHGGNVNGFVISMVKTPLPDNNVANVQVRYYFEYRTRAPLQ